MAAAAAASQSVSAQVVGNAFVQQYYQILHHSPEHVHRFYQDISKLGRPEDGGSMSITTTMNAINEKILSLNYVDFRAEIKSVDAQESFSGGVQVLVTGYLTGKDNMIRNFSQCFFLAPQDRGFFVLNDIFRYIESGNQPDGNRASVNDVAAPVAQEQSPPPPPPPPVEENHTSDEKNHVDEVAEEEVYNPPENGDVPVVEEEVQVPEVDDAVKDDSQLAVESDSKVEEVQKKSYASIVMHLKNSAVPFSSPAPAPRKSPQKRQEEQVNPPPGSETDGQIASSDASDNGNNQEGEVGYSIYIKGLPMNATVSLLENEFKKFGAIKSGGIQVRSNRQQGFCFGFVEFEVPSAVEKALEASPIEIGGRQTVVEEKRSTYSRGMSRLKQLGTKQIRSILEGQSYFHTNHQTDKCHRAADLNEDWILQTPCVSHICFQCPCCFLYLCRENTRGSNRGRFQAGRGSGFRNEGMRGRGSYGGGGRGYYRGDSNGRGEFNSRGGNRGGPSNRGGDGYQRADSNGGRMNHRTGGDGMPNGMTKTMAPRIPATA